jgi:hypothetical protein
MPDTKIIEKPTVLGVLTGILSIIATAIVEQISDVSGVVPINEETLLRIVGLTISVTLGLLTYTYTLNKKNNISNARKDRILKWNDSINSIESTNDFIDSSTYIEMNEFMINDEIKELNSLLNDDTICLIGTSSVKVETPKQRIIFFFKKTAFNIERRWGLI